MSSSALRGPRQNRTVSDSPFPHSLPHPDFIPLLPLVGLWVGWWPETHEGEREQPGQRNWCKPRLPRPGGGWGPSHRTKEGLAACCHRQGSGSGVVKLRTLHFPLYPETGREKVEFHEDTCTQHMPHQAWPCTHLGAAETSIAHNHISSHVTHA